MNIGKAICIAISTYSVLPAPRCEWDKENLRYALCALPLVGLFCGVALFAWQYASIKLDFSPLLFAVIATLLPLAISGGLHMDGFCDTVDALASRQPRARKLEILHDSRAGAFAVIYCAAYLLLSLGLYAELYRLPSLYAVVAGFMLSRALAAFSAFTLPNARAEGMLFAFTQTLHKRAACAVCLAWVLISAVLMICLNPAAGLPGLILAALWFYAYRRMTLKQFGGATGDTTGFFLQVCELLILLGAFLWRVVL